MRIPGRNISVAGGSQLSADRFTSEASGNLTKWVSFRLMCLATNTWPAGGYINLGFFPRDNVLHTLVLTLQLSGRVDVFITQLKPTSCTSAAETDELPDPVS